MTCARCGDTGVWETGNNDLPCNCPAGATAVFNVAGFDEPATGAEIRARQIRELRERLLTLEERSERILAVLEQLTQSVKALAQKVLGVKIDEEGR